MRGDQKQRQLPSTTLTHLAGSKLSAALKKERVATKPALQAVTTSGKTISKSSMTEKVELRDQREAIRGQVRGLNTLEIGDSSPKLEEMMARQKISRRERHIKHLTEYEDWVESFYEQLRMAGVETEEEWRIYSVASQKEMTRTLDEFTDEFMLTRELEWVQAAYTHLNNHIRKRAEEVQSTHSRLKKIEADRSATVTRFVTELGNALNEAAFMLPPQVQEILAEKTNDVRKVEAERCETVERFIDGVRMEEEEVSKRFIEKMQVKEQRWRLVHHNQCVKVFKETLTSPIFVNPPERISLLSQLKSRQEEVFQKRLSLLQELRDLPPSQFSKERIEVMLKAGETLNDEAQKFYDEKIQEVVSLQAKVDSEAGERLDQLRVKLGYYKAQGSLSEFLKEECEPLVRARKEEGKALLEKCIQFLEKTDIRANDVLQNVTLYARDLGEVVDVHKATFKEEEQKHELALASRGDLMDERVDTIEDSIKAATQEARESVALSDLEKNVQKCFELLDQISVEYRSYTKEATDLVASHVPAIRITFQNFQEKVGKAFGLLPESKKEAYLEKLREEKMKQMEAEQIDPKKKSKKEEVAIVLPELEMWQAADKSSWVLLEPLDAVIKRLLYTDEDKEIEEKKRIEEAAHREEEERKAAEELALKKAKKDPKKGAAAEEVKEVPKEPPPPPEDPIPKDPDGRICLATEVYITPAHAQDFVETMRNKALEYVNLELDGAIATAKTNDKKVQEAIVNELDEKMRNLWPRKGRLEVTLVTARTAEINKHHKRLERHCAEVQGKCDAQNKEFDSLKQFLDSQVKQYQDVLAQAKEALATAQTLSELQGIHLRVRDAQQLLFVNEQKSVRKMDALAGEELDVLLKSNRDFLSSLTLISAGGDYSPGEVKYYIDKIDPLDQSFTVSKQTRASETAKYRALMSKEREEPTSRFNKDYDAALESLAAREGLGKKYGAPRRSAQEKLRAEMTKCEVAQGGVEGLVDSLEKLLQEFGDARDHSARAQPLSLDIRRVLLSVQACIVHYGKHLEAFREEAKVAPLQMITWLEDVEGISPSPAEASQEESRREALLEPLQQIGLVKNQPVFRLAVDNIEKLSREECLKLYQSKANTLPEFMEKHLKQMRINAEEFRLNCVRKLRAAAEEILRLSERVPEALFVSMGQASISRFVSAVEAQWRELMMRAKEDEQEKNMHKQALRPNLSNPVCREELLTLSAAEEKRVTASISRLKVTYDTLLRTIDEAGTAFAMRLENNLKVLVLIFDAQIIYEDFAVLPGDGEVERKRTNIKRLARKKLSGKAGVDVGPRGYRKRWKGVDLRLLFYFSPSASESPETESFKDVRQKQTFTRREEVFQQFCEVFRGTRTARETELREMIAAEEKWMAYWKTTVEQLRVRKV